MVPGAGLEPARSLSGKRGILSPLCLPISPSGREVLHGSRILPGRCANLRALKNWRRGPESNRPTRICNPVHNRFATAPKMKKGEMTFPFLEIWSGRRVSNSRPQPWQGCALPTELLPQCNRQIIPKSGRRRQSRSRQSRANAASFLGAGTHRRPDIDRH